MMTEAATVEPGKPVGLAWLKINISYFKSLPGILKLAQLLVGIICMACASPALLSGTHWFLFVAVISFIITLIWVFLYLLSIREALTLPINWIVTEAVNTGVLTVLYAIAFIVQLSVWSRYAGYHKGPNVVAGVFGIINTIIYAAGSYLLYAEWRASSTQT